MERYDADPLKHKERPQVVNLSAKTKVFVDKRAFCTSPLLFTDNERQPRLSKTMQIDKICQEIIFRLRKSIKKAPSSLRVLKCNKYFTYELDHSSVLRTALQRNQFDADRFSDLL